MTKYRILGSVSGGTIFRKIQIATISATSRSVKGLGGLTSSA